MDFFADSTGGSKSSLFSPRRMMTPLRSPQGTPLDIRRLQAMQAETAIKLGLPYASSLSQSLSPSSSQHGEDAGADDSISSSSSSEKRERIQSIMETALNVAYDDINKRKCRRE